MTTAVSIDFQGNKRLERIFKGLEGKAQKTLAKRAIRAATKKLRDKMVPLVPVHTGIAKKLTVRVARNQPRGQFGMSINTPKRAKFVSPKGDSKWYYPAHVELGTSRRPPTPFMRGPLKQHGPRIRDRMLRELWREILKHTRGGGK